MNIPTRRDVIGAGARVAAVMPIHYPRELLRACGFQPMEVWGPPGVQATEGGSHFQSYACAIVHNGASFLMRGGLDAAELLLVPHTCDALQGLGSVLQDFMKPAQPVLTLQLPRGGHAHDADFLVDELRELAGTLSAISGVRPDEASLGAAIDAEEEADRELASLALDRASVALGDRELYTLLRSREYLPAETFAELARQAPRGEAKGGGPGLLISGIVPEPMEVFDIINEAGARVVGDDLACCGRRLYATVRATDEPDPWRRMALRLLSTAPDPTRGHPIAARAAHLLARVDATGAQGVLVFDPKFCEPELFDLPQLTRRLAERGISVLHVEMELAKTLPQQTITRIEAFVETL